MKRLLAVLALLPALAHGQESQPASEPASAPDIQPFASKKGAPAAAPADLPTPIYATPALGKDPSRGFELAAAGTFLPVVGQILGPSFGHFYAGGPEVGRGLFTAVLRAGAVAAIVGGAFVPADKQELGVALLAIGASALPTLIFIDLIDASEAVRRQNRRRR